MKNSILTILLVLIVVFALGFFSKPDDSECLKVAEPALIEQLKEKMPGETFSFAIVENIAKAAVSKGLSVNDKTLYKEIEFTFKGETKVVGYGYLWGVHMNDSK